MPKKDDKTNHNKTPQKDTSRYNLRKKKKKKYKKNITSDSDSDNSEWDPKDESEDEEMSRLEFQKFVSKMFPSKYQNKKVKEMEKTEKKLNKKSGIKEKDKKENKKISKKSKKKKQVKEYGDGIDMDYYSTEEEDGEEEDEEEMSEEYDFPENEDEELDDDELQTLKDNMKFNIVFTVGGRQGMGYDEDDMYGDYDDYYEEGWETEENEEVIIDTEEESESDHELTTTEKRKKATAFKKLSKNKKENKKEKSESKYKKGDSIKMKLKDWDKFYTGKITKVRLGKKKINTTYDVKLDDKTLEIQRRIKSKYIKLVEISKEDKEDKEDKDLLTSLKKLTEMNDKKGKEAALRYLEKISEAKSKKEKKELEEKNKKKTERNVKNYRKLLRQKGSMNDIKYFKTLLPCEQKKILKQLQEVNRYSNVEVPYKLSLLDSNIPVEYKANALKKIETLSYMDPGAGEYYKTKQWVDTFMRIPFDKYNHLTVKLEDGPEKVNEFMENAKQTLDDCCFGLNDAKMQIMQIVGQWISNPDAVGNAIAIKGPPGTGKTTLVKEGVSKILNRPFVFIPLGGATDSSYLEGHSYTYEGSTWGRIVDALITYKSMNPVFYFDELDKVSQTPKGEEIIGILTHLTDTTQNDKFHDKYFANIDFNLNKCLFIFSYNNENKVNPILKDRMYRIHTKGYNTNEKKTICQKYLIPAIEKNINFKEGEIIIPDDVIEYIDKNLIEKEEGVRNIKRAMEIIYTKLNLHRLMKKGSKLFDNEESIKVEFPFTLTKKIVDKLIKRDDTNKIPFGMYM